MAPWWGPRDGGLQGSSSSEDSFSTGWPLGQPARDWMGLCPVNVAQVPAVVCTNSVSLQRVCFPGYKVQSGFPDGFPGDSSMETLSYSLNFLLARTFLV